MKKLLLLILLSSAFFDKTAMAQNLDKIGKEDAVTVSGGVAFNTITYFSKGISIPSREPFTWFASGNVNINILDVALPFTFSYSNQGSKFTQPFNRTALHPQYKWAKSHIGLVSMNFSPYTLTGHLFLGAGVELTPGKWNIQLMGGRLKKAIEFDPVENNINEFSYSRFGYGLKVGYKDKGYGGELIIFKANDSRKSLISIPLNSTVQPQDNLVISLKGKGKITKDLFLEAEYAISGLTQNLNDVNPADDSQQFFLNNLINGNSTTDYFNAFNAALNYKIKMISLALKFEHIDPGYKTLGGYYFNNDLQNYTFAPNITLFKNKLNIGLNTGFQRNNLSSLEASTTNRWIGSANVSYVPNQKIVLNATYSNFSTFTRNRPVVDPFYYQPADTLNFYQLTQAASAMIVYNFAADQPNKSSLQVMYNYQESTNLSGNISNAGFFGTGLETSLTGIPTRVHMANFGYNLQFTKTAASLALVANVNQTNIVDQKSTFFGPTLNFQKRLMDKKANLAIGTTYNRQYTNATLSSNILNYRISFSLNPKFKNENYGSISISANANLLQKFAISAANPNLLESNIFINVNYAFK
ncbi:MAG: hypothetical protein HUJ25_08095 [Crocinitomicaceae bacterium]|nr:hypothetical protein [Crocinitomicaceae bacterium]